MRRFIFSVTAVVVLSASSLFAAETVTHKETARIGQDVGRYQLFQGQYTIYDLKRGGQSTTTIFLIDTATGLVKRYINKIDEDGKNIEAWVPTDSPMTDKKK